MKSDTITKLVLNAVEKKLQERLDHLKVYIESGDPQSHIKKEKDKCSTYLRQVQDIIELFEK